MATTNNQIIMENMILLGIEEEIHTFQKWQALGYSVKKGEKSTIKFPIWKYAGKKIKDEESGEVTESNPHCFMKMSAFFKRLQVEPMKARA